MSKTTIALYIALIFLAGGVAGAGVRSVWKPGRPANPPPVRNREDFANHIFNRMKERLALTPEQISEIEPVFRKGIEDVRAIQDRSVKEVEAVVKRNHEDMSKLMRPDQREKLAEWDRERDKAWRDRKGRRHPGGQQGASEKRSAERPSEASPPRKQ